MFGSFWPFSRVFSCRVIKLQLFIIGFVCIKILFWAMRIFFCPIVNIVAVQLFHTQYFTFSTYYFRLLRWRFLFNNSHFFSLFFLLLFPGTLWMFSCIFVGFSFLYSYSFYNQRININASTCESAYEWRFSLHRYDLIKSK